MAQAGQEGELAPALFISQISNFKFQISKFKSQIPNPKSQIPNPKSITFHFSNSPVRKSGFLSTFQIPNFSFRIFAAYKKIDDVQRIVHTVPDHTPVVTKHHAYHLRCTKNFVHHPLPCTPQKTGMPVAYSSRGRSSDFHPTFS